LKDFFKVGSAENFRIPFHRTFMQWLHRLPSVRVDQRHKLPDCPGIYFLAVGSSIYYVGKALNIRQRHSSESNHDIYIHLSQIRPSLRKLFSIKWITFSDVEISGYSLDKLLLGYEDHMIKTFCPLWNSRQNGIELSDSIIYSITNKIMSISLPESGEPIIDPPAPAYLMTQSHQKLPQCNYDDDLLAIAKEHAGRRKDKNNKSFTQNDWNVRDNPRIQELFLNINSYSKKEVSPADLILLGLTLISQKINSYGLLMEINEDLSILEKFHPETELHPRLLEIAEIFLEMYPEMTFDDLILRCIGGSADYICPLDWAALKRIHSNHNNTLTTPEAETKPSQISENSVLEL
jgi:hypothetical protein